MESRFNIYCSNCGSTAAGLGSLDTAPGWETDLVTTCDSSPDRKFKSLIGTFKKLWWSYCMSCTWYCSRWTNSLHYSSKVLRFCIYLICWISDLADLPSAFCLMKSPLFFSFTMLPTFPLYTSSGHVELHMITLEDNVHDEALMSMKTSQVYVRWRSSIELEITRHG